MSTRIWTVDTTLTEGTRMPGAAIAQAGIEKLAQALDSLHPDIIEVGQPGLSPAELALARKCAQLVKNAVPALRCGWNPKDMEAASAALAGLSRRRIRCFLPLSFQHMAAQFHVPPERMLEYIPEMIAQARKLTEDVEFVAGDAFRAERNFLFQAASAAIRAGVSTLTLSDTTGGATPVFMGKKISDLRENVAGASYVVTGIETRNDLGLALAGALAGLEAGAAQVSGTLGGVGERAGLLALEEAVLLFNVRQSDYAYETAFRPGFLFQATKAFIEATGHVLPQIKPHLGIASLSFEDPADAPLAPEYVGRSRKEMPLGLYTSHGFLAARLQDLGVMLPAAGFAEFLDRYREFCSSRRKVSDDDLLLLARGGAGMPREIVRFLSLGVKSGSYGPQEAEIEITLNGEAKKARAPGKGPVDACFKAMRQLVPHDGAVLTHYELKALTQGSDAKGEVNIRLTEKGQNYEGVGVDTDVIVASARAYIDALNRFLAGRNAETLSKK